MSQSDSVLDTPSGDAPAPGSNPMLDTLRGVMGQSGTIDPIALLQAQLAGQSATDPRTALLLQFLQQRRSAAQVAATAETTTSEGEEFRREERGQRERANGAREIRETMRDLYAELESLRQRNDEFAAAVGACFLCFGEDPMCEECSGLGAPGSRAPEPAAYRKFVLPAMRRAQRGVNRKYGDPIPNSQGVASRPATPAPQSGGA